MAVLVFLTFLTFGQFKRMAHTGLASRDLSADDVTCDGLQGSLSRYFGGPFNGAFWRLCHLGTSVLGGTSRAPPPPPRGGAGNWGKKILYSRTAKRLSTRL